jgi:hypothetical protein
MGFNIFRALVVDLLHEFEIGVWKMLFIHLLRIISAQDKDLIHELDQRYGVLPCATRIQLTSPRQDIGKLRHSAQLLSENFPPTLQR